MHIHSFHRVNAHKEPTALARDESRLAAREPLLIDLPLPLPILSVSVAVPILGLTIVVGGEGRLLPTGIIPSLPIPPIIPPTPVPPVPTPTLPDLPPVIPTPLPPAPTVENPPAQPDPTPDPGTNTPPTQALPDPGTVGTSDAGAPTGTTQAAQSSSTLTGTQEDEGAAGSSRPLPSAMNAAALPSLGFGGIFTDGTNGGISATGSGPSGVNTSGPSATSDPTNGGGNGGGLPDGGDNAKGGLSAGAIAAIVIACLLVVAGLTIFILRRRSRDRQDRQAHSWWFSRQRTSQVYDDTPPLNGRSSSAYTFTTISDRTMSPVPTYDLPSPPPTAEMSQSSTPIPHYDVNGLLFPIPSQYTVMNNRISRTSLLSDSTASTESQLETNTITFPPSRYSSQTTIIPQPHPAKVDSPRQMSNIPPLSPIIIPSYRRVSAVPIPPIPPLPKSPPPTPRQFTSNPFADNNPFDDPTH